MSRGLKRGLAALILAPLLYALLGFFLLPWAGQKLVNQKLAEYASVPARLERIEFNPFSLELNLHGLQIGEADAEQLAFARLYADLQIDSLWRREVHLRELRLEQPLVALRFAADSGFNLAQLFRLPPAAEKPPKEPGPPFPVRFDRLELSEGRLSFSDQRRQPAVEFRYDRLALSLDNLTTHTDEAAALTVQASGPDGADLDWQGELGLLPLRSSGRLSLGATALQRWWPYARVALPLQLQEGMLSLDSGYRLTLDQGLQLQLDDSHLQLDGVKLHTVSGKPLIDLRQLTLSGAALTLTPRAAELLSVDDGRLQLIALNLRSLAERPLLDLARLEMSVGDLTLPSGTQPRLQLISGQVQLADLRLHGPDEAPQLSLESLEAADIGVELHRRQIDIGQIRSRNLIARGARQPDGSLDWQALISSQLGAFKEYFTDNAAPREMPEPEPSAAQDAGDSRAGGVQEVAGPQPESGPWQLLLGEVQLRGWHAQLEDRVPTPAVPLQVGPLDLDLQGLASSGERPFTFKLSGTLGTRGHLESSGQARLKPLSGQLEVKTRDLDLRIAQAYLTPFVHLELRSGLLGAELAVDLQGVAPLAFGVTGSASVNQLHTLDTLGGRDFVRWQNLELDGLDYRHGEQLRIAQLSIKQPYARFIINEDLSTNVKELLIPQPPRPAPAQPGQPLHLVVGGIEIVDGSANFADLSLTPNFATAIQQLGGHIGTLDNRSSQPAAVDISGKVDRYAPVTIKGQLTPFSPLQQLDITTRFRRVELTTLTPYAGKFAGYKIRKGRLNLDLHYRIDQGRLNAENKVLLEGLQLGERVDSPSATDLPVRLAVALLKDARGDIDIALPVKGNLNDPEFSVAPIIWKTLRNLVLRAVQAPFKLIAGLVEGNAERLDSVPFGAGSSELDDEARARLASLAKALQQRPALRLEVEGMSVAALDGPLLAEQRLEREYQRIWYRMRQRRGEKVPAETSQIEVPEEMKAILLEGIYRTRLKQQPPAEWRELDEDERASRLRQALIDFWSTSATLQRRLAHDRARAIKAWLVDQGGLTDERVYLLEVGSNSAAGAEGPISVPLHLDSA